ncbi:L-threonylcarbamoyladenylate synthase [Gulosibacter chungangensis]|uniref:L-threonylcarbamoyladenylate synthase n=1 Tax=Gulosibacter chungangensis TaxID=979746 RepID=UPI001CE461DF|nr:Sua5/YciO/YrdC/YwlC family protein [Gulosibacter chungangensis]
MTNISWNGGLQYQALDILRQEGGVVVSPTKVGYIIVTTDEQGLQRKFELKNRPLRKPGVVLCGSLEQLFELAEVNDEIREFYETHWRQDVLMGCILPWKSSGLDFIPEGAEPYVRDARGTSCFVVRFGTPAEKLASELWEKDRSLLFASSANPSGKGNRGVVSGIGERIAGGVDLVVEGDEYVRSIQPDTAGRYEQGVMVSFVDAEGRLVPEQRGEARRGEVVDAGEELPTLIRAGLSLPQILLNLAEQFPRWNYRHGQYY